MIGALVTATGIVLLVSVVLFLEAFGRRRDRQSPNAS